MPNETMDMIHVTEDIPVRGEYDVIVAGGGVAGVSAALSSSRMGKRVLLIEKSLTLGGLATLGLINFFVPMDNGRGRQIVFGMAEELLRASVRDGYDTIPAEWRRGEPGEGASTRYVTRFSATIFAMTLTGMLASGGVTLPRLGSIGKLGVDYVSSGALTHSVKSADISMDIVPEAVK